MLLFTGWTEGVRRCNSGLGVIKSESLHDLRQGEKMLRRGTRLRILEGDLSERKATRERQRDGNVSKT
jgi:hypothetical protein